MVWAMARKGEQASAAGEAGEAGVAGETGDGARASGAKRNPAAATDAPLIVMMFDQDPVWGLPRRFALYAIGAPDGGASFFRSSVEVLKEVNLQLVSTPFGPEAITPVDAQELAVRYFFRMGQNLGLQVHLRPSVQEAARRERSARPPRGPRTTTRIAPRSGAVPPRP